MTDKDAVAAAFLRHSQMTNAERLRQAETHAAILITDIEGIQCPRCSSLLKRVRVAGISLSYGGQIYCTSCEYRDSAMSFIGKNLFRVEPLPEVSAPIYVKDDEDS